MKLRIAVLSDEGTQGGASIAATRLCLALRARGHHVMRIHHVRFALDPASADEAHPVALRDFTSKALDGIPTNEFSRRVLQRRWTRKIGAILDRYRPDVIHLHNLHNAGWDIEVVAACERRAPVVWTLHDMWAFTGSCAHAMECNRFATACNAECPQVGRYPTLPARMVAAAHRRRRAFFAADPRVTLVSPSRWMARRARASLVGTPVRTIRSGVDLGIFRPSTRDEARRVLCLPRDNMPTFLAVAASLDDPRKGTADLLRALGRIERRVRLLLLGRMHPVEMPENVEAIYLGRTSGDRFLSLAHSAADLFITPSHAENFPLVVLEAMASGRPAAGTPVGGIPEQIRDGMTGWVARSTGPDAMEELLHRILEQEKVWHGMGLAARACAEKRYGLERQTDRYELLHDAILNRDGEPEA